MRVTSLFLDPDSFFRRQATGPNMAGSALVVGVAMVATILGPSYLIQRLVSGTDSGLGMFLAVGGTLGMLSSGFTILLFWLVYSILFHSLANYFGGTSEFRRMFFLTGFGFAPLVFAGLGNFLSLYHVLSGVPLPDDPAMLQARFEAVNADPVVQIARLTGVCFLTWRGFLWAFAIKHAADVELRLAAIPAAVPTVASIVWELSQLVG